MASFLNIADRLRNVVQGIHISRHPNLDLARSIYWLRLFSWWRKNDRLIASAVHLWARSALPCLPPNTTSSAHRLVSRTLFLSLLCVLTHGLET